MVNRVVLSCILALGGLICLSGPLSARPIGPNLVPNPGFAETGATAGLPPGWHRPPMAVAGQSPAQVLLCRLGAGQAHFFALAGAAGAPARLWCTLSGVRPHTAYRLEFDAYRPAFRNGVYLEVEIFGQRHLINQHLSYGRIQPIFLTINSGRVRGHTRLVVTNPHEEMLAVGSPSVRVWEPDRPVDSQVWRVRQPRCFPVGIFAAGPDDLPDIRAAGFNAFQSYAIQPDHLKEMAARAAQLGLKFLPNFRTYQADLSRALGRRSELLGFYIEDEPEGRSVDPVQLATLRAALRRDHPGAPAAIAILRPQMVAEYRHAADIFLLDPYPVPHMPMTWLSDCIEEAARHVSRDRLWAVIQAFGGEKFRPEGWPRPPTAAEMRCLTYLALVHGARGLFYFSYPEVRPGPGWDALQRLVAELQALEPWLLTPATAAPWRLEILSPFRADARGRPAIHWSCQRRGPESLLIMVNVIPQAVEFELHGLPRQVAGLTEYFTQQTALAAAGAVRLTLGPYAVGVYRCHAGR